MRKKDFSRVENKSLLKSYWCFTIFFFDEKSTRLFQQNVSNNRSARNNVYFCFGKNTSAVW